MSLKLVIPKAAVVGSTTVESQSLPEDGEDGLIMYREDHSRKDYRGKLEGFNFAIVVTSLISKLLQELEEFIETCQANNNVERRRALINLVLRHKYDLEMLKKVCKMAEWIPEWSMAKDVLRKIASSHAISHSAREAATITLRVSISKAATNLRRNILPWVSGIPPILPEPFHRLSLRPRQIGNRELFLMGFFGHFHGLTSDYNIVGDFISIPLASGIFAKFRLQVFGVALAWWPHSIDSKVLDDGIHFYLLRLLQTICKAHEKYDLVVARSMAEDFLARILLVLVVDKIRSLVDMMLIGEIFTMEVQSLDFTLKTLPQIIAKSQFVWKAKKSLIQLNSAANINEFACLVATEFLQTSLAAFCLKLLEVIIPIIESQYIENSEIFSIREKSPTLIEMSFLEESIIIKISGDLRVIISSDDCERTLSINQNLQTFEREFIQAMNQILTRIGKRRLSSMIINGCSYQLESTDYFPKKLENERTRLTFCLSVKSVWGAFLVVLPLSSTPNTTAYQLVLVSLRHSSKGLSEHLDVIASPFHWTLNSIESRLLCLKLSAHSLSFAGFVSRDRQDAIEIINAPIVFPAVKCTISQSLASSANLQVHISFNDGSEQSHVMNEITELVPILMRINDETLCKLGIKTVDRC